MRFARPAICAVGVLLLAACGGPLTKDADNTRVSTPPSLARRPAATAHKGPSDATVKADLRNALTAEKVNYVDTQSYTATPATLKMIEPSLAWGHELLTRVADAQAPRDHSVVCLTETSASGVKFAIADIAAGPLAGTFFGRAGCPTPLTAIAVSKLGV
jgi:hypothetical protein